MAKAKEPVESSENPKEKATEEPSKVEKPAKSEVIETNKDARTWAMFCHLAGLGGFIWPIVGNIVAPLMVWQIKKDEYSFVDEQGKEAVNFQISVTIYALVSVLLSTPLTLCVGPLLLIAVVIFDFVMLLIGAVKANNGEHYLYPLCIRFIK